MANTKNDTYDLANISKNLTALRKKSGLSKKRRRNLFRSKSKNNLRLGKRI